MMSYIHETNTHARAQAKTLGIQIWYLIGVCFAQQVSQAASAVDGHMCYCHEYCHSVRHTQQLLLLCSLVLAVLGVLCCPQTGVAAAASAVTAECAHCGPFELAAAVSDDWFQAAHEPPGSSAAVGFRGRERVWFCKAVVIVMCQQSHISAADHIHWMYLNALQVCLGICLAVTAAAQAFPLHPSLILPVENQ